MTGQLPAARLQITASLGIALQPMCSHSLTLPCGHQSGRAATSGALMQANLRLTAHLQSQIGEDGSEVAYLDNPRGHTRSFSSEKIFQDYRAQQQLRSTQTPGAAAPGTIPTSSSQLAVVAEVPVSNGSSLAAAAAAVDTKAAVMQPPSSSFDEEPDNAPSLSGPVVLSDPLGVI